MPIEIVEYDFRWPRLFDEEKTRVVEAIGEHLVAIEHVGSTAVPGLAAKPIVDIMAGIRSLAEAPVCVAPLAAIGYEYVPKYEVELPERRYFRKRSGRRHNLHVVETTTEFWRRHLAFRDWLRAHPEDARRYEALKRRLAETASDTRAYTDGKTVLIRQIEERALRV